MNSLSHSFHLTLKYNIDYFKIFWHLIFHFVHQIIHILRMISQKNETNSN